MNQKRVNVARHLPSAIIALLSGALAGSLAWALPAVAQTAPATGDAVIQAMHDRYAKTWYHTLAFTQKTTLRTAADTMAIETWKEASILPGRLRIDIQRASGNLVAIYSGDSLYIVRADGTASRLPLRNILLIMGFDVYAQPAEQTLAVLHGQHYATTSVREDTWEGRPVYVIGAPPGDPRTAQLWIDKDRLLYVRSIQPDSRDTTKTSEYRFDNYVQVPHGWLSEKVEAYEDGKLIQQEEYSDVRTNGPVDPKIFVPPPPKH
jgi:outer membrane lipoprotein-sorting protein